MLLTYLLINLFILVNLRLILRVATKTRKSVVLSKGQWFGHLNLAEMESDLASKLIDALRTVALQTISGAVADWWPEDPKRYELYCRALSELVTLIDQSSGMPKTDS
jgi:hypothetical protein